MDNRILIGTVTAALIGFLVLPALAVNLWQLIRYLDLSRVKGPAKGIALAAWIVFLCCLVDRPAHPDRRPDRNCARHHSKACQPGELATRGEHGNLQRRLYPRVCSRHRSPDLVGGENYLKREGEG